MADLHQKLLEQAGLLPSQRQWLDRLIFQLEFNPFQLIYIVGGAGTGKSTLTLAIAELLSDEFNLALLKVEPGLTATQARQHLLQHWFGFCPDGSKSLMQLIGGRASTESLALVLDQSENLPAELWAELAEIPCLVVAAADEPNPDAELNLSIAPVTLADAESLLADNGLSTLSVAERLDLAQGNLHVLLDPQKVVVKKVAPLPASSWQPLLVFCFGMLLIAGVVVFWFWTDGHIGQSTGIGQLTYLPEEQEVQPAPIMAPTASKAVVQELVEQLEQVNTNSSTAKTSGLERPAAFEDNGASNSQMVAAPEPKVTINNEPEIELAEAETELPVIEQVVPTLSQTKPSAAPAKESATLPAESTVEAEMASEIADAALDNAGDDLQSEAASELTGHQQNGYRYSESQLLSMNGAEVALQLVVFSNEAALNSFLQNNAQWRPYTYARKKGGQQQYVVVLAPFKDGTAAKAHILQLPEALRSSFVKSLADIHSEISTN